MAENTKTESAPGKTSAKTVLVGILMFIGIMALTFWIIGRQVSLSEMIQAVRKINPAAVVIGLLCMVVFGMGEGLNIKRPLNMLGYKTTTAQGLKYAMVGFFFSSVTPSSTGGQPMQLYYMYHDDVRTSHGLLALLVQLLGWESANIGYAIIGFNVEKHMLIRSVGNFRHLLVIGIVVNAFMFAFVALLLFTKKAFFVLANVIIRIVRGLKLKKKDQIIAKVQGFIDEYSSSVGALRGHPDIVWKTFLTSYIQFAAMYSIPFIVYKGLGLPGAPFASLFFLEAVLYTGVGFIPLPGAVGASESVFLLVFRYIFPKNLLAGAMLLCRTISLYLCIVIDAIGVMFFTRRVIRRKVH